MIIGKYGLLKRVNYRRFIINAVGMGLYALSVFAYVGAYFYFTFWTFSDDEDSKVVATNTIQAYLACNIFSFFSSLSIIYILCQLGKNEKLPEP
jgi:hypothetical protein